MYRQSRQQMFTALVAAVAAGLFHLASPLAVCAQSGASMRVTVTVVPGEGIWAAQRLSQGLVEELAGQLEEEASRNAPSATPASSPTVAASDDAGAMSRAVTSDRASGVAAACLAAAAAGLRSEASGAVAWVESLDAAARSGGSAAGGIYRGDGELGHDPVARITVAHLAS